MTLMLMKEEESRWSLWSIFPFPEMSWWFLFPLKEHGCDLGHIFPVCNVYNAFLVVNRNLSVDRQVKTRYRAQFIFVLLTKFRSCFCLTLENSRHKMNATNVRNCLFVFKRNEQIKNQLKNELLPVYWINVHVLYKQNSIYWICAWSCKLINERLITTMYKKRKEPGHKTCGPMDWWCI